MGGFIQDYTFVLKHKAGVENKVADALSRHIVILVAMSAEVIGFERMRKEYDLCPDFGVTLRDGSIREMNGFLYYKTVIYSDSVSYAFPIRPSGIFLSWKIHVGGLAGHFSKNRRH